MGRIAAACAESPRISAKPESVAGAGLEVQGATTAQLLAGQ